MGYQTHYRSIHPWEKYAKEGTAVHSKWPKCMTEMEDKLHILCCQAPGARQQWMVSIEKLRVWLWLGSRNGTYDTRCDFTKLGGMGTGPTTATGALVNTICKRTGKNRMGKWIDLPILVCTTRTGMEPNHIAKIESSLWDISWDMWEHWNKELHSGGQVQLQIIHSTVNAQIAAAYASKAQQLPRDALHLRQSPVKAILQYLLALKQVLLELIQVAQQH